MASTNLRALIAEAGFERQAGWGHEVTRQNAGLRMQGTQFSGAGLMQEYSPMQLNAAPALRASLAPRNPVRRRDQMASSQRRHAAMGDFAPQSEELPDGSVRIIKGGRTLGELAPTLADSTWELTGPGGRKQRGPYEQLRYMLEGE